MIINTIIIFFFNPEIPFARIIIMLLNLSQPLQILLVLTFFNKIKKKLEIFIFIKNCKRIISFLTVI